MDIDVEKLAGKLADDYCHKYLIHDLGLSYSDIYETEEGSGKDYMKDNWVEVWETFELKFAELIFSCAT